MIKRIILIFLCLISVFGISASATNIYDTITENSQTAEEMPGRQKGPQGGGRGKMGMPHNMTSGEVPHELPEGMAPPGMHNGEMPPQMNGQTNVENHQQTGQSGRESNAEDSIAAEENTSPDGILRDKGNMGGFRGELPPGMTEQERSTKETVGNKILSFIKTYSTPLTSVVLLAFAFVFVIFYKRKSY